MVSKLHSWWQKVKKPLEIAVVSIFIMGLIILIILSVLGAIFQWKWTGFGAETSDPKQHAKTLWDWLQLLIIPAVLAVGGYVFTLTTSRNEQESTKSRDQTERDIASDNQQEAALQAYVDKMSELLLDRKLRESAESDEVRKIARVRTLTVLPRLDGARKRSILQFLYESGLLDKNKRILDLSGPISAKPTSTESTSVKPTSIEPTSAKPISTEPISTEPISMRPTSAKLTFSEPTLAGLSSEMPTSSKPTSEGLTLAEPTLAKPTLAKLTSAKPTSVKPISAGPTSSRPTSEELTSAKPTSAEPISAEPISAGPTSVKQTSAEQTSAEPRISLQNN